MWNGKTVSVILPTYNERDSIVECIHDFFDTGLVDEIVVVNNNAVAGTSEEIRKTNAKEVFESKQGYGHAIRRGFQEVLGDIIIISEPDGTFSGHDIKKLLAYSEDFNAVLGTRTTNLLIWEGANMGMLIKWGNWAVAKMMEFLFNTTTLTDVGCTMRLIKRNELEKIVDKFTVGGSHFGVEMMLLIILNRIKFIEIPVNYKPRVGKSSVTGSKIKAIHLGLTMIWTIMKYRILSIFKEIYMIFLLLMSH